MNPFALIAICLVAGLLLQFSGIAGAKTASRLNAYVIYIALPALVLVEIPRLTFNLELLRPALIAWLVMIASAALVLLLARIYRWERGLTGCLLLLLPLGNTGFVGIPLIDALVGSEGIGFAILYDQFGTFLALNTFGIAVAVGYSGGSRSWPQILMRIVRFPPFISLILALAVAALGVSLPAVILSGLEFLAWSLVPVVMVAVGIAWQLKLARQDIYWFAFALAVLLLGKPALAWLLTSFMNMDSLMRQVVILEAGMPAMISAGVLAMSHQLRPKLAAALVGYSLLLGIPSLLLWRAVI